MITLSKIVQAKKRISNVVTATSFGYAPLLSEVTHTNVYLKKENLQLTGAFKIRGAYNKIATLNEEAKEKGVICLLYTSDAADE